MNHLIYLIYLIYFLNLLYYEGNNCDIVGSLPSLQSREVLSLGSSYVFRHLLLLGFRI
jgi:hypothetical protein